MKDEGGGFNENILEVVDGSGWDNCVFVFRAGVRWQ